MIETAVTLSENKIKQILRNYLIALGWNAEVTHRTNYGIDILAYRGEEEWVISVKGDESTDYVTSFITILGVAVHMMEDSKKKYSIALPDTTPYRNLWKRLPAFAKERTRITALMVNENGTVIEFTR